MNKKKNKKSWSMSAVLLASVVTIIIVPALVLAGNLEPTGPPVPTMKTLDEIEPRTPIKASDLPTTISESGSYYLAENIPSAIGGITIATSNVTLDLSGFSFSGTTGTAIYVSTSVTHLTIQNGKIIGWPSGINALNASDSGFENLIISGATSSVGLRVGNHCLIENCQVINAEAGISGGTHCTVFNTIVRDITADVAYYLGSNARMEKCIARNSYLEAIIVGQDSELFNCIAEGTAFDGGFSLNANCRAEGCVARGNNGYGFSITSDGTIINCTSIGNTGAGIRVTGAGSRLENNTVKGNGTNYDIAGGSNVHEIPPAWSQRIPTAAERFVLVLDGEGVLDKETGLVWARDANILNGIRSWVSAHNNCLNFEIGNRKGWRLPSAEELASLVDPHSSDPALPPGYSSFFDNVQNEIYWSSTTYIGLSDSAIGVYMALGLVDRYEKSSNFRVWPVRGGSGPILVPHTP